MRWNVWVFVIAVAVASLGGWACNHTDYMTNANNGTGGGSTATNGAIVTVGFSGGITFAPSAVTILHGTPVTWYYASGFHTVDVDDGTGTSTCADYNFESSAPGTMVVENFSTAGRYVYHCDVHSTCGGTQCSGPCTNMTGTVSVQ
jgi:plastocyanin